MPSMTYCMFENTETEMSQVVNAMREAFDIEDLELNKYEMVSAAGLRGLCQAYLAEYTRLFETNGEQAEVDISPFD